MQRCVRRWAELSTVSEVLCGSSSLMYVFSVVVISRDPAKTLNPIKNVYCPARLESFKLNFTELNHHGWEQILAEFHV